MHRTLSHKVMKQRQSSLQLAGESSKSSTLLPQSPHVVRCDPPPWKEFLKSRHESATPRGSTKGFRRVVSRVSLVALAAANFARKGAAKDAAVKEDLPTQAHDGVEEGEEDGKVGTGSDIGKSGGQGGAVEEPVAAAPTKSRPASGGAGDDEQPLLSRASSISFEEWRRGVKRNPGASDATAPSSPVGPSKDAPYRFATPREAAVERDRINRRNTTGRVGFLVGGGEDHVENEVLDEHLARRKSYRCRSRTKPRSAMGVGSAPVGSSVVRLSSSEDDSGSDASASTATVTASSGTDTDEAEHSMRSAFGRPLDDDAGSRALDSTLGSDVPGVRATDRTDTSFGEDTTREIVDVTELFTDDDAAIAAAVNISPPAGATDGDGQGSNHDDGVAVGNGAQAHAAAHAATETESPRHISKHGSFHDGDNLQVQHQQRQQHGLEQQRGVQKPSRRHWPRPHPKPYRDSHNADEKWKWNPPPEDEKEAAIKQGMLEAEEQMKQGHMDAEDGDGAHGVAAGSAERERGRIPDLGPAVASDLQKIAAKHSDSYKLKIDLGDGFVVTIADYLAANGLMDEVLGNVEEAKRRRAKALRRVDESKYYIVPPHLLASKGSRRKLRRPGTAPLRSASRAHAIGTHYHSRPDRQLLRGGTPQSTSSARLALGMTAEVKQQSHHQHPTRGARTPSAADSRRRRRRRRATTAVARRRRPRTAPRKSLPQQSGAGRASGMAGGGPGGGDGAAGRQKRVSSVAKQGWCSPPQVNPSLQHAPTSSASLRHAVDEAVSHTAEGAAVRRAQYHHKRAALRSSRKFQLLSQRKQQLLLRRLEQEARDAGVDLSEEAATRHGRRRHQRGRHKVKAPPRRSNASDGSAAGGAPAALPARLPRPTALTPTSLAGRMLRQIAGNRADERHGAARELLQLFDDPREAVAFAQNEGLAARRSRERVAADANPRVSRPPRRPTVAVEGGHTPAALSPVPQLPRHLAATATRRSSSKAHQSRQQGSPAQAAVATGQQQAQGQHHMVLSLLHQGEHGSVGATTRSMLAQHAATGPSQPMDDDGGILPQWSQSSIGSNAVSPRRRRKVGSASSMGRRRKRRTSKKKRVVPR